MIVAICSASSSAIGLPAISLAPTTTASAPRIGTPVDRISSSTDNAVYAKYGDNILRKFYAECCKARDNGEIKLERGSPLTTRQYIDLMSRAAGENVEPLFRQWRGLARELQ